MPDNADCPVGRCVGPADFPLRSWTIRLQPKSKIWVAPAKTKPLQPPPRWLRCGKPAAPALVGTLADDRDDVQANAAVALRQILAADASAIPNKHDMAYWKEKTAGLKPGMPETDAVKLLMQTLSPAARETAGLGGGGTNWSYD